MSTRKETMTSRERVLAALDHRNPDRVPIDLGGNQTGIHKAAYEALIEHLGLVEEIEIMDAVQQLPRPSEAVLERLRVDTRYIHAGAASDFDGAIVRAERDGKWWHDLTDEFGVRWSMPDDSPLYMDITHHPLASATICTTGRTFDFFWTVVAAERPVPVHRFARSTRGMDLQTGLHASTILGRPPRYLTSANNSKKRLAGRLHQCITQPPYVSPPQHA